MIAIRFSVNVKVGCMEKALEMAKRANQDLLGDYKGRIYTPAYGPQHNVLVWEDFWESVAEREAYWEKNLTIQNLLLGGMNGTKLLRVEVPWKSGI